MHFAINAVVFGQWTQLTSGTFQTLNEIFFPAPDTGFVVGDSGTLLRTFNGGALWTALNAGTMKNLNDVFFLNTQVGFVVGDSGYFAKTSDGGNSWDVTYLTNISPLKLSAVFFTSALVGYAGGNENFSEGIIFKTSDGGTIWSVANTPTSFLDITYKRIVFPVPDTGYAISRGMCMKTVDAGNNWFITDTALVSSGQMFSILEDAFFFSADTGFIVGWYNPFCGYTVNGGNNWVDQFVLNNQWYSLDFPSRQIGYMVGWSQLAKTKDGGQTWWDITTPLIHSTGIFSMNFTDDNTGYACGNAGFIMKTTNGGTTGITAIDWLYPVSIYPNPSNGLFEIKIDNHLATNEIDLAIYDLFGKRLMQFKTKNQNSEIDLRNEADGVYLVKMHIGQAILTRKIVKNSQK